MIGKKEMAEVFADFVKKHHAIFFGKNADETCRIIKKKYKGVSDDAVQSYSSSVHTIFSNFAGKGPVEIEYDLDEMPKTELDDLHNIAVHLTDFV